MRLTQFLSAFALTTSLAVSQCAFTTVTATAYGQPCSVWQLANQMPAISVSLDASNCTLGLDVTAFPGCCNSFLTGRVLVLGLAPIAVPVPQFGVNCTMLTSPDVILFQQSSGAFQMSLPAAPFPATTIYSQAAVLYFTTIGLTTDWGLSAGYKIDLL